MKRIALLKTLAVILAVIGTVLTAAGIVLQLLMPGNTSNVITGSESFEPPRELVVITTSMPIEVRYGDTETVNVEYTGSLPLIFTEDKGMLRVTQDDTFTMTLFSPSAKASGVTVTLPHKVYERISLSSSSGSVFAENLAADTLEFGTKSGDMELLGIDERASIRTESGNIRAGFSSFAGGMTIYAGAGDVTLFMPEELSVYLEFFTESGSFTSERFDEPYHAKYGDAAVLLGDARSKLNVNTTSGDLYIY